MLSLSPLHMYVVELCIYVSEKSTDNKKMLMVILYRLKFSMRYMRVNYIYIILLINNIVNIIPELVRYQFSAFFFIDAWLKEKRKKKCTHNEKINRQ